MNPDTFEKARQLTQAISDKKGKIRSIEKVENQMQVSTEPKICLSIYGAGDSVRISEETALFCTHLEKLKVDSELKKLERELGKL